jgi:preprotein translocase subunit SecE
MIHFTVDYIRSAVAELQRVVWPTRREVIRYTAIILVSIVIAMLLIALVDYGLEILVNLFIIK